MWGPDNKPSQAIFEWGYWNSAYAMHLDPLLCFNIPTMISSVFASCFDGISANLEHFRLGSSHSHWIPVTDQDNALLIIQAAPISAKIISWDTDTLLLTTWAIIKTKGLSKSTSLCTKCTLSSSSFLYNTATPPEPLVLIGVRGWGWHIDSHLY